MCMVALIFQDNWKLTKCSGFEEVVYQIRSLNIVLTDKPFNRCLQVHEIFVKHWNIEALVIY